MPRLLAQANRQGIVVSQTLAIPVGLDTALVEGVMSLADAQDPLNEIRLDVQVSPDGAAWQIMHRHLWKGHATAGRVLSFGCGPFAPFSGWQARLELEIARTMQIGADVTLNPAPRA